MSEKILRRKGASEGTPKEEKVGPQDAAKPQEFTPTAEGEPMTAAVPEAQGQETDPAVATEVGDLRAYAPAIEVESLPLATLVEPGDDMREIVKEYAEADRLAEEEEAGDNEEDDEDTSATVSEESTRTGSEPTAEGEPEVEISDTEAKEIADEVRGKAKNVENEQEEIGRIIFHKGFKGRMDLVSSRDPVKSASFPKIHKLLDDLFSPKTLSTLTRGAAFRELLVSFGKKSQELPFGHLRELVSVQDENRRIELAEEVYRRSLSVQKTRKRVAEVNAEKAPEKTLKRIVRKMHDPLSLPGGKEFEKLISDPDQLQKDLSKSERMTLRSGIAAKTEHIDKCLSCLKELDEFLAMIDA